MLCSTATPRVVLAALMSLSVIFPTFSTAKQGPGVSDSEITIGQTMPYSGPLSAYASFGKVEALYFETINARGGINGRRLRLISLDDGFNPAKTVEQTRRLVEQEQVLLLFSTFGTATNAAIQKYVNERKVPNLFVLSGATRFGEAQMSPWTMGWQPTYQAEARAYARYLLNSRPGAKIAVLYQNDDFGKEYVRGLREGLGPQAQTMIVGEASYEPTDPTVDSQVATLKATGADTFFNFSTAKAAAQAIRKAYEIGWHPLQLLTLTSTSVGRVLKPAGLERSIGILSSSFIKDPTDPRWARDSAMLQWRDWMRGAYPDGDVSDMINVIAYSLAQTLVEVLKQCGDDLTRENVMRQAANLKDLQLPMILPGIKINTSPTDYSPIKQMEIMRFDGQRWARFGDVLGN